MNDSKLPEANGDVKGKLLFSEEVEKEILDGRTRQLDRGWAWVVFAACFGGRMIVNGTMLTFNIYFSLFLDTFQESRGLTALIGSVMWACYDSTAIISGAVVDLLGSRVSVFIGCFILSASFLLSSFATNAYQLICTFGLMVGLGCQLVSMGSVCGLRLYFHRYLYFVQGVSTAGAGAGMLILGTFLPIMLDKYGWRGTTVLHSGILFNLCIVASVMFPLRQLSPQSRDNDKDDEDKGTCKVHCTQLWSTWTFWCLILSYFFFGFSYVITMVLFKDYVNMRGLSEHFSQALSLFAIGDMTGRVTSGVVTSNKRVNPLALNAFLHAFEAVLLFGFIGISSPSVLLTVSFLYGVAAGASNGMFFILPCYLYKTSIFHAAFPYLSTATGIGSLIGSPVAGWLSDRTQSYTASYILAGFMATLACLLLVIVFTCGRKRLATTEVSIPT